MISLFTRTVTVTLEKFKAAEPERGEMEVFRPYSSPGTIRELRHVLVRVAQLASVQKKAA